MLVCSGYTQLKKTVEARIEELKLNKKGKRTDASGKGACAVSIHSFLLAAC